MSIITYLSTNPSSPINEWWKSLWRNENIPVTPMQDDTLADMINNTALPENIGLWFYYSLLPLLFTVVTLGILYWLLKRNWKGNKPLKILFLSAWALSFLVYDVGMYTGQYISLFSNAPMAVLHACESFLLGSDISAIHEPFHNSPLFMGLFSFSHAYSAVVSLLFLLKYFGFNIIQKIKLYWESDWGKRKETYIFEVTPKSWTG